MNIFKFHKNRIFIMAGIVLVLTGGLLSLWNYLDNIIASVQAEVTFEKLISEIGKINLDETIMDFDSASDYLVEETDSIIVDDINYLGIIEIPSLNLSLPVINNLTYPNLKMSPCRYSGNAIDNNLIIGAHNYRYHFGRISKMKMGDKIDFTDMSGVTKSYVVSKKEELHESDVDILNQNGDWQLTLFTCTLDGKMRVTIRCKDIEEL